MCKYVANIVSVNGGAVGNISPINEIHTGQNPARHLTLRGAAARGALTFFRLTREDNGIALNIVWVTNTSGQNKVARWRCSRLLNLTVIFFYVSG